MITLISKLKLAAAKRARFNQTYRELKAMNRQTALDLGMYPEDAYHVARFFVYGC